jgi:4-amino-4-deoxy-L-arabinose transferase-like glycosyltransferase
VSDDGAGTRSEPVGRDLALLLLGAALLFSANAGSIPLPAMDDCFYARKGVETMRRGAFFTVTWNGEPTFQNPPLQFWILGRTFALLGTNDLAARLPSMMMALGMLAATWRIGSLTLGRAAGATAAGLLVLSPFFVTHARRCMLEVPLAFWVTLAMLVLVEGWLRPHLLVLLAVPLGGAILTKSVLGLLPLALLGVAMALGPAIRSLRRAPGLWCGALGGLLLGASWPVHQWATFGVQAVRQHYFSEVISRSATGFDLRGLLLDYPAALMVSFQPVVLPGMAGAVALWKRRREGLLVLLPLWAGLPVLLYALSSARSPRYIFPIFPALAYLGSRGQYWGLANPLLYYDERFLESPADSATEALARLRTRRSGLLVVERRRLDELGPATPGSRVLLDGGGFLVLDVGGTTAEVEVDRPGPPH